MTQDEARRAMQAPHTSFMKDLRNGVPTDAFLDHSVHVFYDDSGRCEAIEFYGPSTVLLDDKNLLHIPYSEAKSIVRAIDPAIEEDGAGFTSYRLGVGAYAPSHVEYPDDPSESIIVFKQGYYDKMVDELAAARAYTEGKRLEQETGDKSAP
jgi:hypothetical protein